jgi:hypothetical protein
MQRIALAPIDCKPVVGRPHVSARIIQQPKRLREITSPCEIREAPKKIGPQAYHASVSFYL